MTNMIIRRTKPMSKVRITAVRQTVYPDLMEQYENHIEHACSVKQGQEWIAVDGKCPDGLCPSAWASMREFVVALARGKGNFFDGWMRNPMSAMISCNDGFRPVSFYLEVIEDAEAQPGQSGEQSSPRLKTLRGDTDWRVQQLVQVVGRNVLPRRQIIADLGLHQKSRRTFMDNYLRPAEAKGYITFAYPASPNKPGQAYKLTAKGLELLEDVEHRQEGNGI